MQPKLMAEIEDDKRYIPESLKDNMLKQKREDDPIAFIDPRAIMVF